MDKSPDAFRTISEVAELLDTPAHVLRFWESRFPQIKPVKRAGGRRYYRPADVDLLIGIRKLLHDDGLTIRGVQKILREQGVRHVSGLSEEEVFDHESFGIVPEAAPRSVDPIPLFPAAKRSADTVAPAQPEPVDEAKPAAKDSQPAQEQDLPEPDATTAPVAAKDSPSAAEPAVVAPSDDEPSSSPHPSVTEDSIVLDYAAPAATIAEPADDEAEEDMSKKPTATNTARDQNSPELPFDPPAAEPALSTPAESAAADTAPLADSAVDDDANDAGNIFVDAKEEPIAVETPLADTIVAPLDTDGNVKDMDMPTSLSQAKADEVAEEEAVTPDNAAQANEPHFKDEGDAPEASPESTAPESAAPTAVTAKHPLPVLDASEIDAEWLPADLRRLRSGAFGENNARAEALLQRLQALRNRVGDLGRVPRR